MENTTIFKRLVSGRSWQVKTDLEGTEGLLMEGENSSSQGGCTAISQDRCETAMVKLKQEAGTYSGAWRLLAEAHRHPWTHTIWLTRGLSLFLGQASEMRGRSSLTTQPTHTTSFQLR